MSLSLVVLRTFSLRWEKREKGLCSCCTFSLLLYVLIAYTQSARAFRACPAEYPFQSCFGIRGIRTILETTLRGGLPVGVGRADTGGNPGSVGDKFAFGNTEERARLANMGCKQRGFRGQRAFDHTTGQGYVKSQRGHYHDGIFTKRNKFNLLLHETFGGGFSPPAVAKINRLARKAQRSGVDRTAYPPHSRLSFVSHHAERISIASGEGGEPCHPRSPCKARFRALTPRVGPLGA